MSIKNSSLIALEEAYLQTRIGNSTQIIWENICLALYDPTFLEEAAEQLELGFNNESQPSQNKPKKAKAGRELQKFAKEVATKIDAIYPKNKKAMKEAVPKFLNAVSKKLNLPQTQNTNNSTNPQNNPQSPTNQQPSTTETSTQDNQQSTNLASSENTAPLSIKDIYNVDLTNMKATNQTVNKIWKELSQLGLIEPLIAHVQKQQKAAPANISQSPANQQPSTPSNPNPSPSTPQTNPQNNQSSTNSDLAVKNGKGKITNKIAKKKKQVVTSSFDLNIGSKGLFLETFNKALEEFK